MTRLEELQKELEDLEYRVKSGGYQAVNEAGKPITPGQVRSEIRQYLLESGSTQSKFLSDIGVNSNSYGKFMNGTYKDPWAACQNGTYEAACIFFAIKKLKDQILDLESSDDKPTRKRAHDESGTNGGSSSSEPRQYVSQKKSRNVVDAELADILAVDVPSPCPVFANCDEVREMIREYLDTSGVTQSRWLKAIDVASNSLSRFLHMTGKGMGAGNSVYQIAWRFFEQKRILEGLPKSARRLEQEQRWGESGFPLKHDDGHRLDVS